MEINIEKLRNERRPLWMTSAGVENFADVMGGGGDIHRDRYASEWGLNGGFEFEEELEPEEIEILLAGRYAGEDYLS